MNNILLILSILFGISFFAIFCMNFLTQYSGEKGINLLKFILYICFYTCLPYIVILLLPIIIIISPFIYVYLKIKEIRYKTGYIDYP